MPLPLTYRELFQIGLLLLCVPVQYLLSSSPQSDADKTQALVRLLHDMKELKESWFSIAAYKSLWYNVVAWFTQVLIAEPLTSIMYATIAEDETPAYEVLRYRQDKGHFAMSPVPRTVRPRHLKYRIGQVVRHRSEGYVGVIIGWDAKAMVGIIKMSSGDTQWHATDVDFVFQAPEQWLAREYGDRQAHRHFPHYAVLVDERDPILVSAMSFEASYVVQQDLEVVTHTQVQHTHLNNFFSAYDNAQYIPQHWLKKLYPKD